MMTVLDSTGLARVWALIKAYVDSNSIGSTTLTVDTTTGQLVSSGPGASDWTIDSSTGILSFSK